MSHSIACLNCVISPKNTVVPALNISGKSFSDTAWTFHVGLASSPLQLLVFFNAKRMSTSSTRPSQQRTVTTQPTVTSYTPFLC